MKTKSILYHIRVFNEQGIKSCIKQKSVPTPHAQQLFFYQFLLCVSSIAFDTFIRTQVFNRRIDTPCEQNDGKNRRALVALVSRALFIEHVLIERARALPIQRQSFPVCACDRTETLPSRRFDDCALLQYFDIWLRLSLSIRRAHTSNIYICGRGAETRSKTEELPSATLHRINAVGRVWLMIDRYLCKRNTTSIIFYSLGNGVISSWWIWQYGIFPWHIILLFAIVNAFVRLDFRLFFGSCERRCDWLHAPRTMQSATEKQDICVWLGKSGKRKPKIC